MSGCTPGASSWSTARTSSTCTPCARMIAMLLAARPAVLDTSGERFSVQLRKSARRSPKSSLADIAAFRCRGGSGRASGGALLGDGLLRRTGLLGGGLLGCCLGGLLGRLLRGLLGRGLRSRLLPGRLGRSVTAALLGLRDGAAQGVHQVDHLPGRAGCLFRCLDLVSGSLRLDDLLERLPVVVGELARLEVAGQ